MTSTFRRVGPLVFKITAAIPNRADQIAVWRGGTWNSRPIRPESMLEEDGSRHRHGVRVGEQFFSLVEIMNSPETANPLSQ